MGVLSGTIEALFSMAQSLIESHIIQAPEVLYLKRALVAGSVLLVTIW